MTDTQTARPLPSACRMYDHLIGGDSLDDADRPAVAQLLDFAPDTPLVARDNRGFMLRAARYLVAEHGVRQFLDLGAGIPTPHTPNLYDVVHAIDPSVRMVLVDDEEVAVRRTRDRVGADPRIGVVHSRLQEVDAVLGSPEAARLLDRSEPVAIVITGVLPFVPERDRPYELVATYRDAFAGGHLVLSHALTTEDWPEGAEEVLEMYEQDVQEMFPRPIDRVHRFFDGYELADPGVVSTPAWRPEGPLTEHQKSFARAVAGVGHRG